MKASIVEVRRRCERRGSTEGKMGLEIVFFIGAVILLAALIYGVLSYRYRNRAADRIGEEVTRDRYRRNES